MQQLTCESRAAVGIRNCLPAVLLVNGAVSLHSIGQSIPQGIWCPLEALHEQLCCHVSLLLERGASVKREVSLIVKRINSYDK